MAAQHSQYLESKILTASPHRLHLMLIEGALLYGRQAEAALRGGDQSAAAAALLRVIDLVGEMLAGVRERKTDLNKQISELYWFLFRRVTEAKIHADATALAEALRILEFERETWLMACEKLSDSNSAAAATDGAKNSLARDLRASRSSMSLEA